MRAPQIFLFLGLACPPSVLLTSVMLRGARSSPGDQIPPSSASSAGVPADAMPWCWAVPELPGSEGRKYKSSLGCACQCWSCSTHRDCHVCEQKQRGLNTLPPPCPPLLLPHTAPGLTEKGRGVLGKGLDESQGHKASSSAEEPGWMLAVPR